MGSIWAFLVLKIWLFHAISLLFSYLIDVYYDQNTIVLYQNDNLINHAANYNIFPKNITHTKYSEK